MKPETDNNLNPAPPTRDIWTISRLNLEAQGLLESTFPLIWLEGEISNLSRPASGHLYFSLKDDRAQVQAAMFRGRNQRLRFTPQNGTQVLVRARVTLYAPRGNFQLVVEHMEESGEGRLRREYELLKEKLKQEGLFEAEHKQALPSMPKQIGLITSASGAAVKDMLQVLSRRCPSIDVVIYPAAVQGNDAATQLRNALAIANQRNECDVLIIGRGGGSLEDLYAFNDEQLARDIHRSAIPIVSAVGHEIDFTLADFVADMRAPTPSAAAELVGPNMQEWMTRSNDIQQRLAQVLIRQLQQHQLHLTQLRKRLPDPYKQTQLLAQRIDDLELRLNKSWRQHYDRQQQQLQHLKHRLETQSPQLRLKSTQQQLDSLKKRLVYPMENQLSQAKKNIAHLSQRLHMASPLQTLARGYSISFSGDNAVRTIEHIKPGETLTTRIADGQIISKVTEVNKIK